MSKGGHYFVIGILTADMALNIYALIQIKRRERLWNEAVSGINGSSSSQSSAPLLQSPSTTSESSTE